MKTLVANYSPLSASGGEGGVSRSMLRATEAGRLCKAGRGARSGVRVRGNGRPTLTPALSRQREREIFVVIAK